MKNPFEQYPVIEFKDIRKGDSLAVVTKERNALKTTIGVTELKQNHGSHDDYWYTEGGWITLAHTGMANTTIHLIDRIKPVLPTDTGATIFITKYRDTVLEEPLFAVLDKWCDWFLPKGETAIDKVWLCSGPEKDNIQEWTLAEVKEVSV